MYMTKKVKVITGDVNLDEDEYYRFISTEDIKNARIIAMEMRIQSSSASDVGDGEKYDYSRAG